MRECKILQEIFRPFICKNIFEPLQKHFLSSSEILSKVVHKIVVETNVVEVLVHKVFEKKGHTHNR